MPSALTYPGVYIEEIPSGVRTIIGVGTSIAAFVGRAEYGPVDKPIVVNGYADFERRFGGLWSQSKLGYAVRDFFLNGGSQAVIVRLFGPETGPDKGKEKTKINVDDLTLEAIDEGEWGKNLRAQIDFDVTQAAADSMGVPLNTLFNLTVSNVGTGEVERFRNLSSDKSQNPNRLLDGVLEAESTLVRTKSAPKLEEAWKRWSAEKVVADAAKKLKDAQNAVPLIQANVDAAKTTLEGAEKAVAEAQKKLEDAQNADVEAAKKALEGAEAAVADAQQKLTDAQNAVPLIQANVDAAKTTLEGAEKAVAEAQKKLEDAQNADVEAAKKALEGAEAAVADAQQKLTDAQKAVPLIQTDVDAAKETLDNAEKAVADAKTKLNNANLEALKKTLGDAENELGKLPNSLVDPATEAERKLAKLENAKQRDEAEIAKSKEELKTIINGLEGRDGQPLTFDDFVGDGKQGDKKGLYALDDADLFNILCIPPYTAADDVDQPLVATAGAYCERRRAMLLVDPPSSWVNKENAKAGMGLIGTNSKNAALFFPRMLQPDPLQDGQLDSFVPCGAVAGIFARTDTTRGVWKAPAGFEATLVGVPQLSVPLTDGENGELNPLGINCLRSMPAAGRIVWGSRTLQGDDRLASEWKYIPVRRTALFIEESLYRGTHWVVFEPNDEPLWAQIRLNVGAFMNDLFRQGAFQGRTPREAYFVKCDKETTSQNDIDKGIINIRVGFAPLKPAEFVVIKLQQIAGDIQT